MSDKKIKALKLAAEQKKKNALEKTEKAIEKLIKKELKITVRSVAREAGVSTSYIYKYPELAYQIQALREGQKYAREQPKILTTKSHQNIVTELRDRIKIVEQEKLELAKEVKSMTANIDKMNKSKNSAERLKAENLKLLAENKQLKTQLERFENEICELREFILARGYRGKHEDRQNIEVDVKVVRLIRDKSS